MDIGIGNYKIKYNQLLEKIELEFDSPYDASQTVKVFKNTNRLEMESAKTKSTFNELCGLIYNQKVVKNIGFYRFFILTDKYI